MSSPLPRDSKRATARFEVGKTAFSRRALETTPVMGREGEGGYWR